MRCLLVVVAVLICNISFAQVFCDPQGNVAIYSNYDGGYLNINVDQNIPNLKIGITTYEDCEVTISGTYVNNITEVIYAGFQGNNQHCNPSPPTCTVNGVASNLVSILWYPPVTWNNPYGWNYGILCNYSCDSSSNQGGCNTPDQIVHYYLTQFGGSLYYHYTQYGCWQGTYDVSEGGNCCIGEDILPPQFSVNAYFSASSDSVCLKESILFENLSTCTYPGDPEYTWNYGDGSPAGNSEDGFHAYSQPGNYTVTLTVTDSSGVATDIFSMTVTVLLCGPTDAASLYPDEGISVFPIPANDVIHVKLGARWVPSSFIITDLPGHVWFQSGPNLSENASIDVSGLAKGMYFLEVRGPGLSTKRKIALE